MKILSRWVREWASFRYYRRDGHAPFPRTYATALHAYRSGLLPLEPAIFHAGSSESISSQPLNVHLVMDLMANAGSDHGVNRALAAVLFENLGDADPQISDFAAQTLARLEERYYGLIQDAERDYRVGTSPALEAAGTLAGLYVEFAELQRYNPMLRRFYMQKVLDMDVDELYRSSSEGCEDTRLPVYRVRAFIGMEQFEDAEREITRFGLDETPEGLWLAAEIAFAFHDVEKVRRLILEALEAHEVFGVRMAHSYRAVAESWILRG